MGSWFHQVATSRDFWISFSVAAVFFLGGNSSSFLLATLKLFVRKRHSFTVTGFWIGNCALPSYGNKYCVEIWRLVQRGEHVDLQMFACSPIDGSIDHCAGTGIIRGGILSAIYYSCKPESTESGVLALRTRGRRLAGAYAQYDPGDVRESFFVSDDDYSIARIDLPKLKAMTMIAGYHPFKSFDEIDLVYRATIDKSTNTAL